MNYIVFLFDYDELSSDLFVLFEAIMKRGVINLYDTSNDEKRSKNDNFIGKKKDLFHLQYQDESKVKAENSTELEVSPLQKRCNKIFKSYLSIIDPELFNYMIKIDIDATLFLVRWLKCLFNREFHYRDVIIIWDTILAYDIYEASCMDTSDKIEFYNLNFLDYIAVSMINFIREEILRKDQVECLQRLFKYPPIESPYTLIKMAMNLKELIYKKLRKNSFKNKKSKENKEDQKTQPENNQTNLNFNSTYLENKSNNTINTTTNCNYVNTSNNYKAESKSSQNLYSNNHPLNNHMNSTKPLEKVEKLEKILSKYLNQFEENDILEINQILEQLKK